MSDFVPFFELAGIVIPIEASLEFDQDYEPLAAETWPPLRFMDGGGVKQVAWSGKLRTILTGSGRYPAALDGLDYSQELLLKCGGPRGVPSLSNAIAIPSARRIDAGFEPCGYAVVGGKRVDSPVNVVGNVATVTAVGGATSYGVFYFPEITVWAQGPRTRGGLWDANFSWSLEAEEK